MMKFRTVLFIVALTCLQLVGARATHAFNQPSTYAGYNGKFVFDSHDDDDGQIYTVNADGTDLQALTSVGDSDTASWSPNGQKIVFESNRDDPSYDVYTMNADGSNQARLTTSGFYDGSSVWSPDGSKILFSSTRGGNEDLWLMNADGSNQVNLTNSTRSDSAPKWSPDGSKIIFNSDRLGAGQDHLYIMDADGSNQHRLTANTARERDWDWSPDGNRIAFDLNAGSGQEVFVMDADGSNQVQLSSNPGSYNPRWSPDGQSIAFAFYNASVYTLYVAEDDGSGNFSIDRQSSNLGPGFNYIESLYWSPDGTRIGLSLDINNWNQGGIFSIKPDFSDLQQVSTDYPMDYAFYSSWQAIPNAAPVTATDTLTVAFDTAGSSSVLANDTDERALSGSNLSITVQPAHGTASVNAGLAKINYTPSGEYTGSDTLTYRVCDSFTLAQKCATGTLNITVQAASGSGPAVTVSLTKIGQSGYSNQSTFYTSSNKPTFSGIATPGATISVEIHSDPIILTTTADSSGNWSITAPVVIPNGTHTITITATKDGQTTGLDQFVLGINVEIPDTGTPSLPWALAGLSLISTGLLIRRLRIT